MACKLESVHFRFRSVLDPAQDHIDASKMKPPASCPHQTWSQALPQHDQPRCPNHDSMRSVVPSRTGLDLLQFCLVHFETFLWSQGSMTQHLDSVSVKPRMHWHHGNHHRCWEFASLDPEFSYVVRRTWRNAYKAQHGPKTLRCVGFSASMPYHHMLRGILNTSET